MSFRGWPEQALEFFDGLEGDNSKAYWQRNKAVYETAVRAPMEALLAELEPRFGPAKIFRPHRDVRFTADKSPYKTHLGATVGDGYVQLSADGLAAGSGMHGMASDQLERYRDAVDDGRTGAALERIVSAARSKGLEITARETLKAAPKGYPKDHPRIDLLRMKGVITWKEWGSGGWLGTRKAKDRVVDFLEASKPLNGWLHANVGPSTVSERR